MPCISGPIFFCCIFYSITCYDISATMEFKHSKLYVINISFTLKPPFSNNQTSSIVVIHCSYYHQKKTLPDLNHRGSRTLSFVFETVIWVDLEGTGKKCSLGIRDLLHGKAASINHCLI